MRFPKYWARATAEVSGVLAPGSSGGPRQVACWRDSDRSREEAEERARAAASALAARLAAGDPFPERYLYGRGRPLREELIEVVASESGEPTAAVTRNGYGALILNTARVAFVDVDLDAVVPAEPEEASVAESAPRVGRTLFAVMFGAAAPKQRAATAVVAPPERLHAWLAADRARGARVYRTAGGFRYLLTHDILDPGTPECARNLEALDCDPLYLQLCRAQNSFRARLTPKPWRCGAGPLRVPFPRADAREAARVAALLRRYEGKANRFATCAFVGAFGNRDVIAEAARLIEFHDRKTRASSGLPLA